MPEVGLLHTATGRGVLAVIGLVLLMGHATAQPATAAPPAAGRPLAPGLITTHADRPRDQRITARRTLIPMAMQVNSMSPPRTPARTPWIRKYPKAALCCRHSTSPWPVAINKGTATMNATKPKPAIEGM